MNKKSILFLLLLISFSIKAQRFEDYEFVGSRRYIYDETGLRTEKKTYDSDHKLVSFVHYKYDVHNNKIATLKYNKDSTLLLRYIYMYDANCFKIKSLKYDYFKNKESQKVYWNDEHGNNIRTEYYEFKELIKYTEISYTASGDFNSCKTFSKNGKLESEVRYDYLFKNELIVEKTRYSGEKIVAKSIYGYNENGEKISHISNYSSGKRDSKKRIYSYDSKGNYIQSMVYKKLKNKEHE